MDLWIRSQNKECLMKVVKLDLDNDKTGIFCYSYDDMALMGKYKTKERALEVLDDIERLIFTKFKVENATYEQADIEVKSSILCNMSKIYTMPEN